MNMIRKLGVSLLLLVGLALLSSGARADVTFNATGSNNCFPFTCASSPYQQIYDASGFGSSAMTIYGIGFRAAQDFSNSSFGPTNFNMTIDASHTSVNPNAISGSFAANVTGPTQNVFSGNTVLSSSGGTAYDIVINFLNPYFYDPTAGNLLLEFNVISGSAGVQFDFGSSPLLGRAWSGPNGQNDPGTGLATNFITSAAPVPEPETYAMMMAGLGMLGFMARRRKQKEVSA